jgi:hypothetical protein
VVRDNHVFCVFIKYNDMLPDMWMEVMDLNGTLLAGIHLVCEFLRNIEI